MIPLLTLTTIKYLIEYFALCYMGLTVVKTMVKHGEQIYNAIT